VIGSTPDPKLGARPEPYAKRKELARVQNATREATSHASAQKRLTLAWPTLVGSTTGAVTP